VLLSAEIGYEFSEAADPVGRLRNAQSYEEADVKMMFR
jgi:hypothetical protein